MIKEDKVLININLKNISYYRNLGYEINYFDMKSKNEIFVSVLDLPKKSHTKITAICKLCSSEKIIPIQKYYVNRNRNDKGYYSCFNCKNIEKEKTCMEKYGVKSYSQTQEFHDTESKKWKGIQKGSEKGKKTMLEKYGVDSYFKTDEMREFNKKWMSSDEFKEKSKLSLLYKYGVDSYSKTEDFKKIIESKRDIIVDKIKKTIMEKYGVDWISQVPEIMSKGLATKIKNGRMISDDKIGEFNLYRRKVRNLTNKVSKSLYENWDGYDYYDEEFIKGYFMYKHTHRLYPTIDHKISIFYGFNNSISPSEIGDISNLCITKRSINSTKRDLINYIISIKS